MGKPFKHKNILAVAVIAIGVMSLIFGVLYLSFNFASRESSEQQAQQSNPNGADTITQVLTKAGFSTESRSRTITSTLGFDVSYDPTILDARAQTTDASSTAEFVSGITYVNDEVEQPRDYSIIKFRPKTNDETRLLNNVPELTVLTNIRKDYWENRVNLPQNSGKDKLQIFIDQVVGDQLETDGWEASQPKDIVINGINYKMVTFTYTTSDYGLDYKLIDHYYFTVQNDRPYYAAIKLIRNDRDGLIADYESVINTINFNVPDQSKLSLGNSQSAVLGADDDKLLEETRKAHEEIDPATIYNVIVRNQIAVVRIAAMNCYDLEIINSSLLSSVCAVSIGSGSIVSTDGYIATNGHVVDANVFDAINSYLNQASSHADLAERAKPIAEYLTTRGLLPSSQISKFLNDVASAQKPAVERALSLGNYLVESDVVVKSHNRNYAIQLSDKPLVLDASNENLEFEYTGSNVKADLIALNYDNRRSASTNIDNLKTSDVAILKINGNFPIVAAAGALLVQPRDQLTAIGFPGFIDGGLQTKEKTTFPSITQGFVEQIVDQPGQRKYKLIITNVPLAQGNSGGPAFNKDGEQIGINTYSRLPCSDGSCFGNGIIRNFEDLKELASNNNVSFVTDSGISATWEEGIRAFQQSKYKQSKNAFETVADKYMDHYLANAMADIAQSKMQKQNKFFVITGVTIAAGLGLTTLGIIWLKRIRNKRANSILAQPDQTLRSGPN